MRLLFVPTTKVSAQNDYLEVSILHGLRALMGNDCVDYPRKKIMYHDFSDIPKDQLSGKVKSCVSILMLYYMAAATCMVRAWLKNLIIFQTIMYGY